MPLRADAKDHIVVVKDNAGLAATAHAAALPATLDYRSFNGKNFVPPIMDQGRCGSCVAFATTGTFETQLNLAANDGTAPFQLSPQYLFSCGGGACSYGWNVGPAATFLTKTGIPDNDCMPYGSGPLGADVACSKACSDAKQRVIKAKSFTTPTSGSQSTTAIKSALVKGPLIATMTVYADFDFYTGGVYKHVTGEEDGGHAVSIIGWNDTDQAWIVRNQWGTEWGQNGFFEIAYSDTASGVGAETWLLTVTPPGQFVGFADVRDYQVFSGTTALTVDGSAGLSNVSWTLSQSGAVKAQGTSADGTTASIDTTTIADGVYELQGHATGGGSSFDGEKHVVYVLNGTETGTITFDGLTEGQQIVGEAQFNVDITSSPVPLTQVVWTVTDASGATMLTHQTFDTGSVMQLYWDTTRFPNGAYTVSVTGFAGTQSLPPVSRGVKTKN